MNDLTNKIINGIQIKYRDETKPKGTGKSIYWICICPICQTEFSVRSNHLLDKIHPIKICAKCSRTQREDLIGQKFNKLIIKKMLPYKKYERTQCLCDCECGTKNIIVQANHLKAGEIQSCGCLLSKGEEKISNILAQHNIFFERQKVFKNCNFISSLRFDFYLPLINTIIEYNGIQHYQPVEYFGGKEQFINNQKRDQIKREYCLKNNIQLIEIKYSDNIEKILTDYNIIIKR